MPGTRGRVARLTIILLAGFCLAAEAGRVFAGEPIRAILSASRKATLSSEISLPVRKIHRQMGESFAAGDVLIEFNDELAVTNVEAAKATLQAAFASFEAVSSMYTRKNASRVDLEMAKRENTMAEAKLRMSEYELSACVIKAPFAGRIEEILVNEHELVSRGEKLMVIVDDTVLRAQFLVPEEDYRKIAIGDAVTMQVLATGEMFPGALSNIAAVFDPASRTFEAWASVDNSQGKLRAGMNALVVAMPAEDGK